MEQHKETHQNHNVQSASSVTTVKYYHRQPRCRTKSLERKEDAQEDKVVIVRILLAKTTMHPEAHQSNTCARQAITAQEEVRDQFPVQPVNIATNTAKTHQTIVQRALPVSTVLRVQRSQFNAWLATNVQDQQQLQQAVTYLALLANTQVVKQSQILQIAETVRQATTATGRSPSPNHVLLARIIL